MQIEQRMSGDVTIVTITGDITLNKGGDVILKDKIHSLLQQGNASSCSISVACPTWTAPASVSWCR